MIRRSLSMRPFPCWVIHSSAVCLTRSLPLAGYYSGVIRFVVDTTTYEGALVETAAVNIIKKIWLNEPAGFVATVQTLIALAIAFGIDLTAEQSATILAAITAIGGLLIRSQVTPTKALQAYADAVNPPEG